MSDALQQIIDKMQDKPQAKRNYLGASAVGYACKRHVQYYWLTILGRLETPHINSRTLRIFDRGNIYEDQIRKWMLECGFVFETDDTKLQFQDFDDRFRGHVDGVLHFGPHIVEYPTLWECKCLNNKNYEYLENNGLKKSKPIYYAQVQIYMHYLKLKSCLFTAINADNMKIYDETVEYDKSFVEQLLVQIQNIFDKTDINKLVLKSVSDWNCRFCDYKEICT